jgi:hypothetical protein
VDIAISTVTIQELEHIKENEKDEKIKYKAREAVRSILTTGKFETVMTDNKKIDKMLKKYSFLSDIPDHRILCAAEIYAIEHNIEVIFMTSDALQYLFALQMPHLDAVYPMGTEQAEKRDEEWAGWGKYYPSDSDMALMYADPKMNILKCQTNEFAEIYEGSNLKDVLTWTGQTYRPLKYKELKIDFLG